MNELKLFDNPLFIIAVLTGFVFLVAGVIMNKFPPKAINSLYGYRTAASMKSQERWDFAQRYSSRKFMQTGVMQLLIALINCFYRLPATFGIISGLLLMILCLALLIFKTEKELRQHFG